MKGFALLAADPNATDAMGKITNAIAVDTAKQVSAAAEKICADLYPKFLELTPDVESETSMGNARDSAVTTTAIAMVQQSIHILRKRQLPMSAVITVIALEWPELIVEIVDAASTMKAKPQKRTKKPRRKTRR